MVGLSNVVVVASGDDHCLALAPNAQIQATNASATRLINTEVTIAFPVSNPTNDPFSTRIFVLQANGPMDLFRF